MSGTPMTDAEIVAAYRAGRLCAAEESPQLTVYETKGPHISQRQRKKMRKAAQKATAQGEASESQKTHATHVEKKAGAAIEIIGELRDSPFGGGSGATKQESANLLKEAVPMNSPFGHGIPLQPEKPNRMAGGGTQGRFPVPTAAESDGDSGVAESERRDDGVSPSSLAERDSAPWCPKKTLVPGLPFDFVN